MARDDCGHFRRSRFRGSLGVEALLRDSVKKIRSVLVFFADFHQSLSKINVHQRFGIEGIHSSFDGVGVSLCDESAKPEPAEIEFKNMRFLITYRPTDATMDKFIEELKKHNVKDVVRVCEPSYKVSKLSDEGISVVDLPFDDGTPPPEDIVSEWFDLLKKRFTDDSNCCIAVHCIAGLGRAPVLVALALIELGMKYEDAVELIREKRRGAINAKQLAYLEKYHPKSRLKNRNGNKVCTIM